MTSPNPGLVARLRALAAKHQHYDDIALEPECYLDEADRAKLTSAATAIEELAAALREIVKWNEQPTDWSDLAPKLNRARAALAKLGGEE